MAILGEQHVFAFEVAVHDAAAMGRHEAAGDLAGEPQGLARAQRLLAQQLGQRGSAHPLEHDRVLAVAGRENVVHLDDRRVRQLRHRPRLAQETLAGRRAAGAVGADPLDRHVALQPFVPGEENLAHPALAEPFFEPIRPQLRSRRIRRVVVPP